MERFIKELTAIDLKARQVQSRSMYPKKYIATRHTELDDEQLIKLQDALKLAEYKIKTNTPKFWANLPWNLCKINTDVEGGMPHTHGSNIYYSDYLLKYSVEDLAETLIHERVHIMQRILPGLFHDLYINILGYEHVPVQFRTKLQRLNPDTFGFPTYSYKGKIIIMEYRNENPKHLNDCALQIYDPITGFNEGHNLLIDNMKTTFMYAQQLEHPNEVSACIIAKLIMDPYFGKEFSWLHERMYQWLLNTEFMNVESNA
jgi:hypothetical protein